MAFGASSCPSVTPSWLVCSASASTASLPAPFGMMEGSTRYLFREEEEEEEVFKGTCCRSFGIFSGDTWAGGNAGFVSGALRLFTNSPGEAATGEDGTWHRQAAMPWPCLKLGLWPLADLGLVTCMVTVLAHGRVAVPGGKQS